MYYKDHQRPHFHAKYAGQTGVFSLPDLRLVEGALPKRVVSLVLEWAFYHRDELTRNWELARAKQPLLPIPPLEWQTMRFVRRAAYAGEYRLLLTFEDGEERLADLGPHLDGKIFEPLKDIAYFNNFRVNEDLDTVVWENGADFSPDFLYEIGRPASEATRAADA